MKGFEVLGLWEDSGPKQLYGVHRTRYNFHVADDVSV